jgi:hypothetical protein
MRSKGVHIPGRISWKLVQRTSEVEVNVAHSVAACWDRENRRVRCRDDLPYGFRELKVKRKNLADNFCSKSCTAIVRTKGEWVLVVYLWPNGIRPDIFYRTMYIGRALRGPGAKKGGWGSRVARVAGLGRLQLPRRAVVRGPWTLDRARKIASLVVRLWSSNIRSVERVHRLL